MKVIELADAEHKELLRLIAHELHKLNSLSQGVLELDVVRARRLTLEGAYSAMTLDSLGL
jgi:hypothetical protein